MDALLVKSPFGGLEVGDLITDPQTIKKVLASENANLVIKTTVEDTKSTPLSE